MIQKLRLIINFAINMKPRYLGFRVYYAIIQKIGFFEKRFPINPKTHFFISKSNWQQQNIPFFTPKGNFSLTTDQAEKLKQKVAEIT
jgi:hypothetical protein